MSYGMSLGAAEGFQRPVPPTNPLLPLPVSQNCNLARVSEWKIRVPKRRWEWTIWRKMWDELYLCRKLLWWLRWAIALEAVLWQSIMLNISWEWEIRFKKQKSEWKIVPHWVSFPTQIDQFWDTDLSTPHLHPSPLPSPELIEHLFRHQFLHHHEAMLLVVSPLLFSESTIIQGVLVAGRFWCCLGGCDGDVYLHLWWPGQRGGGGVTGHCSGDGDVM